MRERDGDLSEIFVLPELVVSGSSLPLGNARSTAIFYHPHSFSLTDRGGNTLGYVLFNDNEKNNFSSRLLVHKTAFTFFATAN